MNYEHHACNYCVSGLVGSVFPCSVLARPVKAHETRTQLCKHQHLASCSLSTLTPDTRSGAKDHPTSGPQCMAKEQLQVATKAGPKQLQVVPKVGQKKQLQVACSTSGYIIPTSSTPNPTPR
jgi:hypothetical protein